MIGDSPKYTKPCPQCGENFDGRRNQKFCNANHKALYHAAKKKEKENAENEKYNRYKKIVDILIRNCEILDKVASEYESAKFVILKDELRRLGYNFEYHTALDIQDQYNVFMCFDNGLKIVGIDQYELITKS